MASAAAKNAQHPVRAAAPEDREALRSLYARCRLLADWLPEAERSRCDFDGDTSGEEIFAAFAADGTLDGFVSFWKPGSFIHHLYVRPEARRQGVAGALLDALVGRLSFPWRLKCVRVNQVAMAFYAKRGWREVGQGKGAQGHHAVLEMPTRP